MNLLIAEPESVAGFQNPFPHKRLAIQGGAVAAVEVLRDDFAARVGKAEVASRHPFIRYSDVS
ncbi:MAG: hypothetical protein QGF59_20480, partial [Pirellulaceae bacterium]|nr:hypothetical protein [Pirellulaceae bacterium]